MAADMVIWENIKRTLDSPEVALLLPLERELKKLRDIVWVTGTPQGEAVAALEGCWQVNFSLGTPVTSNDQSESDGLSGQSRHGPTEKLSTLLHEADDLLDQILTLDNRTRVYRGEREGNRWENRWHLMGHVVNAKVSHFLSFSNQAVSAKKMAREVEKMSKDIETEIKQLRIEPQHTNQPDQQPFQWSLFRQVQYRGDWRTNDKEEIVSILLQPPRGSESNVSTIWISGPRGVGKSALAKDIYEDNKVQGHFDLRMWIPVSQITDETDFVREIVVSCTDSRSNYHNCLDQKNDRNLFQDLLRCRSSSISTFSPNDRASLDESEIYERRLRKEIRGKLFLLILDDVCLPKWMRMRDLLGGGARGSQILVTTQRAGVTDLVISKTAGMEAYQLQGLSENNSKNLFKMLVETDDSGELERWSEIANICEHVPLTLKVAARHLQGKKENEWSDFTKGIQLCRDQEEDVMERVLHLSYSELPNRLRACFGYCFLFPDDYTFNKHDLISLWIAQGFIAPSDSQNQEEDRDRQGGQSLEEVRIIPDGQGIEEVGELRDGRILEEVGDLRDGQRLEEVGDPRDGQRLEEVGEPRVGQILEEVGVPREGPSVKEDVGDHRGGQSLKEGGDPRGSQSLEEVGEMYFMELTRRCLFEQVGTDDLGNILTGKIHPIVRSHVSSKFTAGVANMHMANSCTIPILGPTFKHISVNCERGSSLILSPPLLKGPSLRTLIFIKEPDCDMKMDAQVCSQLISRYRWLRVLDLKDLGIIELPDSIGDNIHLRYLDLSKNDGLVALPKSITRLYNLQTLKLNSCPKLKRLANDFGLLVNLKRLEVDECESLNCMPLGLEKLTRLETLSRFVVGKGSPKQTSFIGLKAKGSPKQTSFIGLKALSGLNMLRGRLAIEFKGDWTTTNIPEAKQALSTKTNLVEVKIIWPRKISPDICIPVENEILSHEEVLENLKPNVSLKILYIEGYKGNDFPSWASKEMISSLPNLVILSIEGCGECQFLPPFGELAHLKKLTLRHMTKVKYIEGGSQEPVEDHPFFKSLEELTLHNFFNLEGWRQEAASVPPAKIRSFPCLSKLRIWNCPKLTSFPSFTEALELNLQNVNHLLLEEGAKQALILNNQFRTTSLQIKGFLALKSFRAVTTGLGGLTSLKHLVIENCDALISLTDDIGQITSLKILEISNCRELDLSENSKISSRIRRALSVSRSPWKNMTSLQVLKLREIPKMNSLPDGLMHVKTLRTLWISACQSVLMLPEWISSLTSLQHLRIESCPAMKSLPEGLKKVKSLMKIEITECPELMQRCREHRGEDWPKIKHARVLLHKSRRYGYVHVSNSYESR